MKVPLTKFELIEHWANLITLSVPILMIGYVLVDTTGDQNKVAFTLVGLALVYFLLIRHKLSSLRLNVYRTSMTESEFKQANSAAAKLNDWEIVSNKKNYFSAINRTGWQWDGIRIFSILRDGKVFLNAMVNPSIRSNPFVFGLDEKMKHELIKQYKLAIQDQDVMDMVEQQISIYEEKFWSESEFSTKNFIMRIVGYVLSFVLIAICVLVILEKNLSGIIVGLITIGFVGQYLYYDMKIIREKKRRTKPGYNKPS